jgi:LuxR family quorum sensing-dependent transcriptional regulator
VQQNLSHLSKGDLFFLIELISRSLRIQDGEDMRNILLSTKQLLPAEDIVAGLARMNVKNQDLEVKRIINVSYSPDWLALYMERKYFLTDPILQTHYRTFQPQIWSETYKKHSSPAEKEFISHSHDFGLVNGVSLGVASSSTGGSLFSFSGRTLPRHPYYLALLETLVPHLHAALSKVVIVEKSTDISLTSREKEILQWTLKGYTGWEISKKLHISERTVMFHVVNAMKKLKAQNRAQAAAMALSFGLLEVD